MVGRAGRCGERCVRQSDRSLGAGSRHVRILERIRHGKNDVDGICAKRVAGTRVFGLIPTNTKWLSRPRRVDCSNLRESCLRGRRHAASRASSIRVFAGAVANTLRESSEGRVAASTRSGDGVGCHPARTDCNHCGARTLHRHRRRRHGLRTLFNLTWVLDMMGALPIAAFVLAVSVGLRRTQMIPQWLSWGGIAVAVLLALRSTTWARDGFWSPTGEYLLHRDSAGTSVDSDHEHRSSSKGDLTDRSARGTGDVGTSHVLRRHDTVIRDVTGHHGGSPDRVVMATTLSTTGASAWMARGVGGRTAHVPPVWPRMVRRERGIPRAGGSHPRTSCEEPLAAQE